MYLHIGTVKSGTTYLQSILRRNNDALRSAGLRLPEGRQVTAVREVLGMQRSALPITSDAWARLVGKCMRAPGRGAIVSMEFLSFATDDQAKTVVDSFAGAEVHIILTARDLLRVVPSGWQNALKNGRRWTFEEYVAGVMRDDSEGLDTPGRHFWLRHDLPGICRRWIDLVGAERFHLVTVPASGTAPDVLWTRFASVIGVDATTFEIDDLPPANPSLSLVEAEFMLRVVPALPKAGRNPRVLRGIFANKLVRGGGGPKVAVPRAVQEWSVRRAAQTVDQLRGLGMDVVGSLDDLIPVLPPAPADGEDETPTVTSADLAATGVRAAAALLEEVVRRDGRAWPTDAADPDDDLNLESE